MLFPLGDHRADAGRGVEARNARAPGPHPFSQSALRVELQLQLAGKILAHELGILAHVGRDHLLHLPGFQKLAKPEAIDARVVRGDGQTLDARIPDRRDQQLGDAAQAKTPGRDQHPVL
jgi:hypothetical protein